ncbi:MAG: prepilin-type N-terminal cleavage/methylation domain-containing protein [bacterium]
MRKERGFSLIELIFVIFIIGILAVIAIPNFIAARDKTKIAAAKNNLNTILKGINMYYVDHGYYPEQGSMNDASSISVLQEELADPDNYLHQFYDNKIHEYKNPSEGDNSPFDILVRTNAGANREGKVCWLYYSEEKEMIEVWISQ